MGENAAKVQDYFAELYVAGRLADAGWAVYFPHRDIGFDFIISKSIGDRTVIRPVQVKGKYPESEKTDKPVYGYVGKLSQSHPEMVLAIPYFSHSGPRTAPVFVAYMPWSCIKKHSRGYRCQPAKFKDGMPKVRGDHGRFFDSEGIGALESEKWKDATIGA